jgi:hypothetical protein
LATNCHFTRGIAALIDVLGEKSVDDLTIREMRVLIDAYGTYYNDITAVRGRLYLLPDEEPHALSPNMALKRFLADTARRLRNTTEVANG